MLASAVKSATRPAQPRDGVRLLVSQGERVTHARFPDLAAKDFRRFLCVEAAVARQPVSVAPGEEWWGRQTVVVLS